MADAHTGKQVFILGTRVDPTSYSEAVGKIIRWAQNKSSCYVCITNVNNVMEAHDSSLYQKVMNQADLSTPDGMPLVWTMRRLGYPNQERVYGPELARRLIDLAAEKEIPIGFYGSTRVTLQKLLGVVSKEHPALKIVFSYSPPFYDLSEQEDNTISQEINESGARILFVGLGCPKQERWMADHKGKVQAAMVGVGAAFDFLAGTKSQAPHWMQENGFEWFYRLSREPRRLWRRYFCHNPRFIVLVMWQLLKIK